MPPRTKPLKVLHISPKELNDMMRNKVYARRMAKILRNSVDSGFIDLDDQKQARIILEEIEGLITPFVCRV